jgi:hypothetical protein
MLSPINKRNLLDNNYVVYNIGYKHEYKIRFSL